MHFDAYDPERFASLYAEVGPQLRKFFASPVVVALLEGSVKLRRPAVEAIEEQLLEYAKDDVKNQRVRQLVGHMIRHLMEELGYELDQPEVRLPSGVLFTCGARYRKAKNARRTHHRMSTGESGPRKEGERMKDRVSIEQLARWRREAEELDKLADHGSERRARVAVIDVSVAVSLLDEVDRLRRTLSMHASDGSFATGPIPASTLQGWRVEAQQVTVDDARWSLADRLLGAIDELEQRRRGAAAALASPADSASEEVRPKGAEQVDGYDPTRMRAATRGGAISNDTLRAWRATVARWRLDSQAELSSRATQEMITSLIDEIEWSRGLEFGAR